MRKRRAFGLDAPRPRDPLRLEAVIREWLGTRLPSGLVLRVATEAVPRSAGRPTLLVLLPGCRVVLLDIGAGAPDRPPSSELVAVCKARGIALALVSSVEDVQAAFRGLGVEPEER